jgi:acetyl-CoA acetyltransferase
MYFLFYKGLAPIKTIQEALRKAKWSIDTLDLFELNEAYASQAIAVIRELRIDPEKVFIHFIKIYLLLNF